MPIAALFLSDHGAMFTRPLSSDTGTFIGDSDARRVFLYQVQNAFE